jgi:hypothetical protein
VTQFLAPPTDLGIPLLGFAFIGAGALVVLVVVIVLEAIVFRWMMPGGHSVRDSLIVNLVSSAIGVPVFIKVTPDESSPSMYALWAATWVLTVLIEAILLRLLRRQVRWTRVFLAAFVANVVSYALLIGTFAALLQLQ